MEEQNEITTESVERRDALGELQARLEAAMDEVRPKIRNALEELESRFDSAVADLKPRAQNAMREVQPRIDQFVADVQPRLDDILSRLQGRIDELRGELEARALRQRESTEPIAELPAVAASAAVDQGTDAPADSGS